MVDFAPSICNHLGSLVIDNDSSTSPIIVHGIVGASDMHELRDQLSTANFGLGTAFWHKLMMGTYMKKTAPQQ